MSELSIRIKELRNGVGLTQQELADKLGMARSTVGMYESGKREPDADLMKVLANIFDVSVDYLIGVKQDALPQYSSVRSIGVQSFPVLGAIACGDPILMNEEREVYVDSTTKIHADFILIAKGDSMIGARIYDGDLVFIRKQPTVENGEIAAVAIDDEATLKRFYKYNDDLIVLRAENPNYSDMEFRSESGKIIRVLGKAVAFQSDVK